MYFPCTDSVQCQGKQHDQATLKSAADCVFPSASSSSSHGKARRRPFVHASQVVSLSSGESVQALGYMVCSVGVLSLSYIFS